MVRLANQFPVAVSKFEKKRRENKNNEALITFNKLRLQDKKKFTEKKGIKK